MSDTLGNLTNKKFNTPETSEETIKMWIEHLSIVAFVYDAELDRKSGILKYLSILSFLIASVASIASLIQYSINSEVLFGITTAVTISNAITSGTIQILGLQESVKLLQKHSHDTDIFLSELMSRELLPLKFQNDADDIVILYKDRFTKLLLDAPNISNYYYKKHFNEYKKNRNTINSVRSSAQSMYNNQFKEVPKITLSDNNSNRLSNTSIINAFEASINQSPKNTNYLLQKQQTSYGGVNENTITENIENIRINENIGNENNV